MRIPFVTFGIDVRGSAVLCTVMTQAPHKDKPDGHPLHLPLFKLDARGLDYTFRMFGHMAFVNLRICHSDALNILNLFPPIPAGDERFAAEDEPVAHLVTSDTQREQHVSVGLSDSALQLVIARRVANDMTDIGNMFPLRMLEARGAEAACMTVGDTIMCLLVEQHADVFAKFPALSFQSEDNPDGTSR